MVTLPIKSKKSTISALIAFGFFGSLFLQSFATPAFYCYLALAGILISALLTVYFWRVERRVNSESSPVGIWIILAVFLLYILLCLVLPAIG
jgi:phosphoglycerol transferase MdoB-like AlkP superfamily enzyme